MGEVCCRPEAVEGNDTKAAELTHLKSSNCSTAASSYGKGYSKFNSMDRVTWFTEHCEESGDEEFYTKGKLGEFTWFFILSSTTSNSYHIAINLCDFKVKHLIGKGNYSKVYLVHKVDTNKPYAMKVINKSELENSEHKRRVMIEKEIMQYTDSPFIVKLHYTFQTAKKLYFILDFVNGGELHMKLIKEVKLKEKMTIFYVAEILLALKALHERKIIYRDLKPRNILLDSDGHLKLVDFGLCKLDKDDQKEKKMICGTPNYVAPEMLKGAEHTVLMDYWSLGVITYEMLHGYFPFITKPVENW